jgi:ribonuclease HII
MLLTHYSNLRYEAGTDEAGRGCLAGPVTAAAVINPLFNDSNSEKESLKLFTNLINDSKVLSEKTRFKLRTIIEEIAISFAITHVAPKIIDEINILNASILAMQESIKKLNPLPIYIIVDGNRFKPVDDIPFSTIVKGDSKYLSIAAASILAKTYRDDYMNSIHEEFPMYNWKQNKGYPTKEHREAIKKYGTTKYHRMSFRLF